MELLAAVVLIVASAASVAEVKLTSWPTPNPVPFRARVLPAAIASEPNAAPCTCMLNAALPEMLTGTLGAKVALLAPAKAVNVPAVLGVPGLMIAQAEVVVPA